MLTWCLVTMAEPDAAPISPITAMPPPPSPPSAPAIEAAPLSPPAPTGLLTRAAKGKARAQVAETPPVTVSNPSAAPYVLRSKKKSVPCIESSDEGSGVSDDDTPKKATEMPSGVAIPRVQVEVASPPRPEKMKLPIATGGVCFN